MAKAGPFFSQLSCVFRRGVHQQQLHDWARSAKRIEVGNGTALAGWAASGPYEP